MNDWTTTFDAVFFLTAGTLLCGGVGVLLGFCFKSKCAEFALCSGRGCIYVRRDVDAENEETKMELEHPHAHLDHIPPGIRTPPRTEWGGSIA